MWNGTNARIMKEQVRISAGKEWELVNSANKSVEMERMEKYHNACLMTMVEENGRQVKDRPKLIWMYCVKVTFGSRGMTVEAT